MKKLFLIGFVTIVICSCDKNKEIIKYTTLYHIENEDTLSGIAIPNAFTPNSDGINDQFRINELEIGGFILNTEFLIEIYDHNGQVIFSTTNIVDSWDGTYLSTKTQSGSYDYHLTATDSTGYQYDYRGRVSHMR